MIIIVIMKKSPDEYDKNEREKNVLCHHTIWAHHCDASMVILLKSGTYVLLMCIHTYTIHITLLNYLFILGVKVLLNYKESLYCNILLKSMFMCSYIKQFRTPWVGRVWGRGAEGPVNEHSIDFSFTLAFKMSCFRMFVGVWVSVWARLQESHRLLSAWTHQYK